MVCWECDWDVHGWRRCVVGGSRDLCGFTLAGVVEEVELLEPKSSSSSLANSSFSSFVYVVAFGMDLSLVTLFGFFCWLQM